MEQCILLFDALQLVANLLKLPGKVDPTQDRLAQILIAKRLFLGHLGLQFMGALKDTQDAVYSHFIARDRDYLAGALGMSADQLPGSYSELGGRPMQAFQGLLDWHIKSINVPRTIHKSQLGLYKSNIVGTPQASGEGLYDVTLRYQALVDDVAMGFSRDYSVKAPFLSRTELGHLKNMQPSVCNEIMEASKGQRGAYGSLIRGALASTGDYQMPRASVGLTEATMQGMYAEAVQTVKDRHGVADMTMVNQREVNRAMADVLSRSEFAKSPLVFGSGEGQVVTPSPNDLQRFRAAGPFVEEEVAPVMSALIKSFQKAGTKGFGEAVAGLREEVFKLVGSRNAVRRATGAFVDPKRMQGDVVRGHDALALLEGYAPSLPAGDLMNMVRFPTQGESSWDPNLRVVNLSRAEALKRGLDPDSMYASKEISQAAAGDADGDLMYALVTGKAAEKGGVFYDPQPGRKLADPRPYREAAKAAIKAGAGDLMDEYAAGSTLEQARAVIADQLKNPHRFTEAELAESIQSGMGMYGNIGRYYNTFARGTAQVDPTDAEGRRAMQHAFNLSHGRAQRLAPLTEGIQHIQDLMTYNPATHGVYQRGAGKGGAAIPGMSGLMTEAAPGLMMEDAVSPEQFAALMGPADPRTALAAAAREYRTGPGSRGMRLANLTERMTGALGAGKLSAAECWAVTSPMGRLLAGQAVNRGRAQGLEWRDVASQLASSEGDLYTVPANTAAVGVTVHLYNTSSTGYQWVYLYIQRSSGTSYRIGSAYLEPCGFSYAKVTALSTGDKIRGYADSATTVNYTIIGGTQ